MSSEATVERRGHGRDTAAAIADASERLARAGVESARLDAELLMAAAAGVSRATVIAARSTQTQAARSLGAGLGS